MGIDLLLTEVKQRETVGVDVREDLHFSPLYHALKDARSDARDLEKRAQIDGDLDVSQACWANVESQSLVLLNETLDIELMAWLCEALLRTQGFSGCAKGFELLYHSFKRHGFNLYPALEEGDGLEWKVIALSGLNGQGADGSLIVPLNNVPILDCPRLAVWQINQIRHGNEYVRHSLSNDAISYDKMIDTFASLGVKYIDGYIQDIKRTLVVFNDLNQCMDLIFGESSPPSSRIKQVLVDTLDQVTSLKHFIFPDQVDFEKDHNKIVTLMDHSDQKNVDQDNLNLMQQNTRSVDCSCCDNVVAIADDQENTILTDYTRTRALRELLLIADYFMQSEPQSPIPTMLNRVVDWANLSWSDLMNELMSDSSELDKVLLLTGVNVD